MRIELITEKNSTIILKYQENKHTSGDKNTTEKIPCRRLNSLDQLLINVSNLTPVIFDVPINVAVAKMLSA
jgi:hypothetical protein